jgi:hypothetical protein
MGLYINIPYFSENVTELLLGTIYIYITSWIRGYRTIYQSKFIYPLFLGLFVNKPYFRSNP